MHYDRVAVEALLEQVEGLSAADLDALPCGLIKLDLTGKILTYNRAESELSGLRPGHVEGKNFFTEVAPCTKVKEFHGRFLDGVARGELNETFDFLFRFAHGDRHVAITLNYSPAIGAVFIVVSLATAVPVP